jgi:enediyne polyketide synthase
MACRYPDANDPGELWQTVLGRRRAFRRMPEERLRVQDHAGEGPDSTYVTHAGLLRGWEFDRDRFRVPGALYRAADQTHWLALEVAADALADAGFPGGAGLDRDEVGVVLGNSLTGEFSRASALRLRWPYLRRTAAAALRESGLDDAAVAEALARYEELVKRPFPEPGDETLAGALSNTIAGRICNQFDFHGTGYTVDGACASSLLSVMAACRALGDGELSFALAGGVDLSMDAFEMVGFARLGALAHDEMRVYDAEPTGFLPGEGCGVVALMRAEDAERSGLRIYAYLVGWGTSSDGAGGLTRPEASGQALALRRAYRMGRMRPADVGLIEGHGTGTAVGDRVELEALSQIRGFGAAPAALSSVKANIGHTKAAAGVAGLIKATLAVHHRVLPPVTGCREPHELLLKPDAPIRLPGEPEPWREEVPRAGVSSMGFGGINSHVVVEGGAHTAPRSLPSATRRWSAVMPDHDIVLLRASSPGGLARLVGDLAAKAARLSQAELHDLAASAYHGEGGAYRAALVAARPEELARAARAALDRMDGWTGGLVLDPAAGAALGSGGPARIGVLLPGQAAPVRARLGAWADGLGVPDLPGGMEVRDGDVDTAVAQPAIVRQSLAGLAWLAALGCEPVAAVGHSLGEITALAWAGALTPAHAVRLAAERGRVMAEHGIAATTMAGLAAGAAETATLLDGTGAVMAAFNTPGQTVISGPAGDVELVAARARARGISATPLPVSHAFHSPAMAPAADPLRHAMRSVPMQVPGRTVVSTITGRLLGRGDDLAKLLVDQLTRPVRFVDALSRLTGLCDLLVEAGPGTMLSGLVSGHPVVSLDCGGHPRRHAMATAALAAAGSADLAAWFDARAHRPLPLSAPLHFLSNPCEAAPETAQTTVAAAVVRDQAPVAAASDDPLECLREHLAAELELPASTIDPGTSLLGDLHLNSLRVARLFGRVAVALNRQPPVSPLMLADATVAEAADALAALPEASATGDEVMGVRNWVRAFAHRRVPYVPASGAAERTAVLRRDATAGDIAALLADVGASPPASLLVCHDGHPAAEGVARSVAVECEETSVTCLRLQDLDRLPGVAADRGYLELAQEEDGTFTRTVTGPHGPGEPAALPLGAGDVCLVTGGVKGITAYAARALAERTGCSLVILGRTPEAQAGESPGARYISCDVTDGAQVEATLAGLGPVRGLVHGAGVNRPRRMATVTPDSLGEHLAPKVAGLSTLLAAAGEDLRMVVAFGSIIGRHGLAGQAEYCVANDWMRSVVEDWAAGHPACRTHLLEWSVWSGLGMGVDLGALDALRRQGVMAIGPDDGVDAMLEVLSDPAAPCTVLLAGRLPALPTRALDGPAPPLLRFTEVERCRTPGVEAVYDAELGAGTDPYLADHRIDGLPVLPAVLGMEAMAQAATATGLTGPTWSFSAVRLSAPVVVEDAQTIRLAALAHSEGEGDGPGVDAVLRDASDGFATDRFTARIGAAGDRPEPRAAWEPPPAADHGFYDGLFFHTGRFKRVLGYRLLTAFRVEAWVDAGPDGWFSSFHAPDLLLGDPGLNDASIHALLACLPHRQALPVAVERFTVWRPPSGVCGVSAVERHHDNAEYVYDVDLHTLDGEILARWQGLRLRAVGPREWPGPLPASLAGPWLSRWLGESDVAQRVELVAAPGDRAGGASAELAARLTGGAATHDPAGALRVPDGHASASYADGHVLLALAAHPVGVDWERSSREEWPLGDHGQDVADAIAVKAGEPAERAAARVWTAREALVKAGRAADEPLVVQHVDGAGTVLLGAGPFNVATVPHGDLVVAVAVPMEI